MVHRIYKDIGSTHMHLLQRVPAGIVDDLNALVLALLTWLQACPTSLMKLKSQSNGVVVQRYFPNVTLSMRLSSALHHILLASNRSPLRVRMWLTTSLLFQPRFFKSTSAKRVPSCARGKDRAEIYSWMMHIPYSRSAHR